jgi:hypothetical protein
MNGGKKPTGLGAGSGVAPEESRRRGAGLAVQIGEPDNGGEVSSGRSGTTGVLKE